MFSKPFRVKSNNTVKSSERKKLRGDVSATFSFLTSENLAELMPPKEDLSVVKVFVHKGDAVLIYFHKKNPIIFELEGNLYPTVYTLWRYPDLLPVFTTWQPVFEKLMNGADLMLPGIVVPSSGLPEVQQGSPCAVTLMGNRAPVAIGLATMSTKDMIASGMKGKGFSIMHIYKDQLWAYGDKSCSPNILPSDFETAQSSVQKKQVLSQDSQIKVAGTEMENLCTTDDAIVSQEVKEMSESVLLEKEVREETSDFNTCNSPPQEAMDDLLSQCFLHALKFTVKKSDLPLLTSTFHRNYLVGCCPEGQQVDIKKSSYKKLSKFLQAMQERKILQVKELSRGVESIVEIHWEHPDVRSFVAPTSFPVFRASETSGGNQLLTYQPPTIIPLYGISEKILPLFQKSAHRKDDLLTKTDVRSVIVTYVKISELVHPDNKSFVIVNSVISDCLLNKSEQSDVHLLSWDDLVLRCLERMQPAHQVIFPGCSPIIRKGNLELIDISIAQRASNKKVTIIKNLEPFGLDPTLVAGLLQQKVQASISCTLLPGAKHRVQVQIQGNQVSQIGKLLLEHFRIPKKYVYGLDLAAKSDKKK